MSAVAVAIGSFAAGFVFGAYWATRKSAAEPAHVSRLKAHLDWLKHSGDDRSEVYPYTIAAGDWIPLSMPEMQSTPERTYRLKEGQ